MKRRDFVKNSATGIISIGAASSIEKISEAQTADTSFSTDFKPQKKCFMDQYYEGMLKITKGIRDTQIVNIKKAMEKAYELKSKGGNIYSQVVYGHYPMFAGSKDRPGQPWILPQSGIRPGQEEYDAMKKGDFLITNYTYKPIKEVRDRGVYIVGITNSYCKFYKTPPDALRPNIMETAIEDISDLVIDSQVPWDNGLIDAPQFPHFKLFPSTGFANFLVYWACTASLANLIGTKGKGSGAKPTEKYLDLAYERFQMIGTDRPKIDRVADKWADLVLGKKARLLVYGHPQEVEPYVNRKNMFVNESVAVACGTMIAEPYDNHAQDLRPEDIVLIGAFTSDNADEIRVARHARSVGAYTVAFCSYSTDGDSSGLRLFKEVNDAFNTYSDESAGVINVKGFKEKVSPLTGVTGNLVHWMLTSQWADHMSRRGEMPYFYPPLHEEGGREYREAVSPYFQKRGY